MPIAIGILSLIIVIIFSDFCVSLYSVLLLLLLLLLAGDFVSNSEIFGQNSMVVRESVVRVSVVRDSVHSQI